MEKPLVSIIVAVYNIQDYLPVCLESLRGQTYDNLEIMLVDDGATDRSGALCDEFAAQNPCARVFHKANGGQSSARNLALDHAKGDYILIVDGDDQLAAPAVEDMVNTCRSTGAEVCCMGVHHVPDDGVRIYCQEEPLVMTGEEAFAHMLICDGLDSNPWGKLYRRTLWKGIRYPEGVIFEDTNVTCKLLLRCGEVARVPKPYYGYTCRPTSTTQQTFSRSRMNAVTEAEKLLAFVQKSYPQYADRARALYLKNTTETMIHLARLPKALRAEYADCWAAVCGIVRENMRFLFASPYIARERKLVVLTIWLHIYPLIRSLKGLRGR